MVSKTSNKWKPLKNVEWYQKEIKAKLEFIWKVRDLNVNTLSTQITDIIETVKCKYQSKRQTKIDELCKNTKNLMKERRALSNKHSQNVIRLRKLNRKISREARKDIRIFNTREVRRVVEEYRGMKTL